MEKVKLDNVPCVVWVHEAEESAVLPVKASGEPGDSCWQTVLPLLEGRPVTVTAGSVIRTKATVELPGGVDDPLRYSVDMHVLSPAAWAERQRAVAGGSES